ncbi:MAG: hypothetical protein AAGG68_12305 [Bacteroidota bacterium]
MSKLLYSKKRLLRFDLIFLFLLGVSLIHCTSDKSTSEVSDRQVDVKIKRFEQELFALDANNSDLPFDAQLTELVAKYPEFYEVFKTILTGSNSDSIATPIVQQFIQHEGVRNLYDTTQIVYDNVEWVEKELGQAFAYHQYYFPGKPVPEVVSYVSEYGVGAFTYGDSLLAIGWDFFLGEDFHYDYNIFPAYLQKYMTKDHLIAKAIETLASNSSGEVHGDRLLDHIVANGKMLYIKSLLLPDYEEDVLMEWTPEQLEWMKDASNERELWTQLAKRDLLYSTRRSEFDKLIVPSPMGATWMPRESPGKAGNWIGWQIIKSYMAQHPEMSIEEMVIVTDAQAILNASKYRPPRS